MSIIILDLIFSVLSKPTLLVGHLVSRDGLPIGRALDIQYPNYSTKCNLQGLFALQNTPFTVNVLNQFTQHFEPTLGQTTFTIDNNKTITAHFRGTLLPAGVAAKVSISVNKPLNLKYFQFPAVIGTFDLSLDLMQLMVYEADLLIQAEGFRSYQRKVDLYDQYLADLGTIELEGVQVEVRIRVNTKAQTMAVCQYREYQAKTLFKPEGQGELVGRLDDAWPQYCLLFSTDLRSRLVLYDGKSEEEFSVHKFELNQI